MPLDATHASPPQQQQEHHAPQREHQQYARTTQAAVRAEIEQFETEFTGLAEQFRLLDKIGEGTFSFVYKAVDLWSPAPQLVAVKRIHATSSPKRIGSELQILAALQGDAHVCKVTTALRHRDQVLVVMPYIDFTDFRQIYTAADINETRHYMRELLLALAFTARKRVIHRDVKPTNFLYDLRTRRGVLVDFGLAEFQTDRGVCTCTTGGAPPPRDPRPVRGYLQDDSRPARRANRAGTRGFRAPEVLLKCARQDHKVDVWAAGVVMLMMLAQRFPFFNSLDDADALVEMATIFGRKEMRQTALLHNCAFETNIPTVPEHRRPFTELITWSREQSQVQPEERDALDLLNKLMALDCRKRVTAEQALQHPFFRSAGR